LIENIEAKMEKKIFILFILLSTNISQAQYFAPLELGNTWVWQEWPDRIHKLVVIDTVILNGKSYFHLGTYFYCRFDTTDNIYYYITENQDVPYYKKSFNVGDTISFGIDFYKTVIDTQRKHIFGILTTEKAIHFVAAGGLVEAWELWTEEFGLIYRENSEGDGYDYLLRGCIINGKVYGDTTIVGVKKEELKPPEVKLYQNYPNPFNPITNIKYEINSETKVKLSVYDILGQKINLLVDELQYPGIYTVVFKGEGLPSGIYIYKLIIGGQHETKKMILLR